MSTPQFPYLGNQVIIKSGRIVNYSSDDYIFLFGEKGVAVSTKGTFTVDTKDRTTIASPKIELGFDASTRGEPVLLGRATVQQLIFLINDIKTVSDALNKLSTEKISDAIPGIIASTTTLSETATRVSGLLNSPVCLSTNTFTR